MHQRQNYQASPGTAPLGGVATLGNDPRNRWTVGSSMDLGANMELDLHLRHVSTLPSPVVPSYTALDARWGWHVRPDLELSLTLRGLGQSSHPEWGSPANRVEFDRSAVLKAVWRL